MKGFSQLRVLAGIPRAISFYVSLCLISMVNSCVSGHSISKIQTEPISFSSPRSTASHQRRETRAVQRWCVGGRRQLQSDRWRRRRIQGHTRQDRPDSTWHQAAIKDVYLYRVPSARVREERLMAWVSYRLKRYANVISSQTPGIASGHRTLTGESRPLAKDANGQRTYARTVVGGSHRFG